MRRSWDLFDDLQLESAGNACSGCRHRRKQPVVIATAVTDAMAALVDVGPTLLATSVNSELTAFKPSDKQYVELARFKLAETEIWAHPVAFGNKVLVRDRESVALWSFD